MDRVGIGEAIEKLSGLQSAQMHLSDFLLTWEKTDDELAAVFGVAEILQAMRRNDLSTRIFDSGLAVSIFRDHSTRTRFSFASASNLLGLALQDLDEGKSQIAHGETVRETANMISFMAEAIGIRDDMYIGKGNAYMREVARAVQEGYAAGILERRPTVVNLQCDVDHPTQSMADAMHVIAHFGGLERLRGKKLAMSWAYSPSYGKPLSVPQGVIGLMTRFGMEVVLAHPRGYEVMRETLEVAKRNAVKGGGSFAVTNDMREAFQVRISSIPRAGRRTRPWRRAPTCMDETIWPASRSWKRSCWLRTRPTQTGSVPNGSCRKRRRAAPCTCTACRPTSPA